MIAMQYSFTLPADYDMSIIDRRIKDNGYKLDGFPDLCFKSYLSARIGVAGSSENLYAPFYLWERPQGMDAFLSGPGFKNVSGAFGWPNVASWIVWHQHVSPDIRTASFAARNITSITPHSDLSALRVSAVKRAKEKVEIGALTSVTGFDPGSWSLMEFSLWTESPDDQIPGQSYQVGYIAS